VDPWGTILAQAPVPLDPAAVAAELAKLQ